MSSTNRLNRPAYTEARASTEQQYPQLLSRPQVKELVGNRSDSSMRRDEAAGRFPRRVKIGPRQVAWFADEIFSWLENLKKYRGTRPSESDGDYGRVRKDL